MNGEQLKEPQKTLQQEWYEKYITVMPRLIEADKRRDWETVCDMVMLTPEIMSDGLKYVYDHLPDDLKFMLPVECYTQNGDRMPAVRKYVRQARKYAPIEKRIPPELQKKSVFEIYRAGEEPIELAKYRISWTTDLKVAQWFYDRALLCGQSPSASLQGQHQTKSDHLVHRWP